MTNVNTPILSLPPTVGALAGDEVVALVQNQTTKKTTVRAIAGAQVRGPYANNAAAVAAGLAVSALYYTAAGEVRIVV